MLAGLFALVFAAAISYSRVYVGVNYLTDVVAGAGLGITSGWMVAGCVVSWRWLGRFDR